MKIIALIILLTVTLASAQNISRTEVRGMTNTLHLRVNAANNTNATQTTAIAAAASTNAANTSGINAANATNAAQTVAIAAANDTNATQTAAIAAANTTNAAQTIAIARTQNGSITLSNFLAYLIANGVTNIASGTNTVLYVANGTLVINSQPSGRTNLIDVLAVTNLITENFYADFFGVGTLVVTNNRAYFADGANHQIDGNIAPEWEGTNSMTQGTRLAITNTASVTNHQSFIVDLEGDSVGGSNYALTNTFPAGDLASLNGGALAMSFTDTVTNGTAVEDSWRKTWKRGTNIWIGYRAWRTR